MEMRSLGVLQVSAVGLGCNNFGMRIDQAATQRVVDAAIDVGITYFDTAESYGGGASEEMLGRALAGRRDQVVIATKWGHTSGLVEGERGGDPATVRRRLEGSLRRLGTDRIDHYQLHRPDPATPPEETLGCLAELRDEGKRGLGLPTAVEPHFEVQVESVRGRLPSPFGGRGLFSKTMTFVTHTALNETVQYSDLQIHLIAAHGFYQGVGSPFRLDPEMLVRVLEGNCSGIQEPEFRSRE